MDSAMILLVALGAAAALLLNMKAISVPLRLMFRVALNTLLGLGALLLVNATTALTGLSLGMNLFNAAVVGIFGVPGLGLLFLAQWVLA